MLGPGGFRPPSTLQMYVRSMPVWRAHSDWPPTRLTSLRSIRTTSWTRMWPARMLTKANLLEQFIDTQQVAQAAANTAGADCRAGDGRPLPTMANNHYTFSNLDISG